MAGLIDALVTGQNLALKTATPVADVADVGATYAQAEVQAVVDALNALLAELRGNGLIAPPTE